MALRASLRRCSRAFILIDGLDELVSDAYRHTFLSNLFELQKTSRINILATSRFNGNIEAELSRHGFQKLVIYADDEDVRSYLTEGLSQMPNLARHPDLCDRIITDIIAKAAKMFLLAKSLLSKFVDSTCRWSIEYTISILPESMNGIDWIYDDAMQKIKNQGFGFQFLAQRVLSWLTFTRRPLTIQELQHALAAVTYASNIDIGRFQDVQTMTSVCAGLVMVDEESQCLCFTHYTIKGYLENSIYDLYLEARNYIARTCIKYLSFSKFKDGPIEATQALKENENAFYDCAATNWGHHVIDGTLSYQTDVLPFMKSKNAKESIRVMKPRVTNVSLVHLIAHFGLDDMVPLLTRQDKTGLDSKDSEGNTTLAWAASQGHKNMVKVLLSMGACVDSKDASGRTPLFKAACNGHEDVVILLLRHGAELETETRGGLTVLSLVAKSGDVNMMRLLLANGAKVDAASYGGLTPIFHAVASGHEAKVQVLIDDYNVSVWSEDDAGRTPIFTATMEGHITMVEMLIDRYSVSPHLDNERRCLLSYAAGRGHMDMVKLLIKKYHLLPDSKDYSGRDSLSYAAQHGHVDLVRLFIDEYDISPNPSDFNGTTPLIWAAYEYKESSAKARRKVVQTLLMEYNVDKGVKDKDGDTALSVAIRNGDEEMVKLLAKS